MAFRLGAVQVRLLLEEKLRENISMFLVRYCELIWLPTRLIDSHR